MAKKERKQKSEPVQVEKKLKEVKPKKYAKTADAIFRINKSKNQRIFLLRAERQQDFWAFGVQGTKGSHYNVMINQTVFCSCMDFRMKKKPCKHIYFIVTQVAQNQQILDYFRNSTSISKNAYKVLDQQLSKRLKSRLEKMSEGVDKKDIDLKDDTDCVICFTQMNKDEQKLQDCSTCKKYFHVECIARWKQQNPTCPLCRGNLVGGGINPLDKLVNIVV